MWVILIFKYAVNLVNQEQSQFRKQVFPSISHIISFLAIVEV
jgi:hypothetical protein